MASRVLVQLVSDLSGDEIADGDGETIDFGYRGLNYRIDLTSEESAAFDDVMATYLTHATKRAGGRTVKRPPNSNTASGDAKAIRAWAKEQGITVPDRGRIPADVRTKYEASS